MTFKELKHSLRLWNFDLKLETIETQAVITKLDLQLKRPTRPIELCTHTCKQLNG